MVKVLVIPANEESILARETVGVVMKSREQTGTSSACSSS